MEVKEDLQTRIESTDSGSVIFVDKFDDEVLVSIQVRNGSARCLLSKQEAIKMIGALKNIVESM